MLNAKLPSEPELRKTVLALEPLHRLWNSEDYQALMLKEQDLMEKLMRLGLVIGEKPQGPEQIQALELIGADAPKNQEEQLRLYLQFRAVVNFWTRKRDQLKAASEKYVNAKQKLQELGKQHGDIPQRRIGVR